MSPSRPYSLLRENSSRYPPCPHLNRASAVSSSISKRHLSGSSIISWMSLMKSVVGLFSPETSPLFIPIRSMTSASIATGRPRSRRGIQPLPCDAPPVRFFFEGTSELSVSCISTSTAEARASNNFASSSFWKGGTPENNSYKTAPTLTRSTRTSSSNVDVARGDCDVTPVITTLYDVEEGLPTSSSLEAPALVAETRRVSLLIVLPPKAMLF